MEQGFFDMTVYGTLILACMSIFIGFLAQRSRMCFVAGIRDYILVRDGELLMGMFAFLCTIWVLTSLLYAIGILRSGTPEYGVPAIVSSIEQIGTARFDTANISRVINEEIFVKIGLLLISRFLYVTLAGGLVMGFISVLAGGCVLRQHVLLAQGSMDAVYYILGFYVAVVIYYGFLYRFFIRVY